MDRAGMGEGSRKKFSDFWDQPDRRAVWRDCNADSEARRVARLGLELPHPAAVQSGVTTRVSAYILFLKEEY